jgi:hypothetical protein
MAASVIIRSPVARRHSSRALGQGTPFSLSPRRHNPQAQQTTDNGSF